jgi:hypothetical protein
MLYPTELRALTWDCGFSAPSTGIIMQYAQRNVEPSLQLENREIHLFLNAAT